MKFERQYKKDENPVQVRTRGGRFIKSFGSVEWAASCANTGRERRAFKRVISFGEIIWLECRP